MNNAEQVDRMGGVYNPPKISVLIPLYNRRHYIADCINSVLNQTFQDFELIVRDDGSTDGSADFVAERFAAEISTGKIKLKRNEKNLGQFVTDDRLTIDASGKYIAFLHSDDLYMPYALQHLYEIAEHFQADVVHPCKSLLPQVGGVIDGETPLYVHQIDGNPVQEIKVMSDDPAARFSEYIDNGTFVDKQYNLYRRDFILENEIFSSWSTTQVLFHLKWVMTAKVYVKTPEPTYINRCPPDSKNNVQYVPPEKVADIINLGFENARYLEKIFSEIDFFKNNEEAKYRTRVRTFQTESLWWLHRLKVYGNGVYPELNAAVENCFRKYFGENAFYPAFLFNWIHCLIINQDVTKMTASPVRPEDKSFKYWT